MLNVKEKFLELVKTTVPHGYEHTVLGLLPDIQRDFFGNAYIKIGENPKLIFTSHLDTFSFGVPEDVNVKIKNDFVTTDGSTILGADDKAGVVILLSMIEAQIPGLYYFFVGEEIGRLGSKYASTSIEFEELGKDATTVVSFDRMGYSSIITHQRSTRTCEDDFAYKIKESLNESGLKVDLDPTGSVTDSYSFLGKGNIKNCTNISVGYFDAHSGREKQDLKFLELICKASTSFDWNLIA